jgi:hypothetical protein
MAEMHKKRVLRQKFAALASTSLNKGAGEWLAAMVGVVVLAAPQGATALNLYNGANYGNNVEVNLNTTLSWTPIWRVGDPSAKLTGGGNPAINTNGNQGDSDFQHGLVSNQLEIASTLDLRDNGYGVHVSGEAYLNPSYLQKNQNDESPLSYNPISTASNRDFTSATRNVNGENARLLDAFVYGTQSFNGGNSDVSLKVGRQTLIWGQSLFFAGNGIAAGMAPVDAIVAQNTPNAQTQQILLPVGQVVATWQINDTYTLQGYYQFEWENYTLQGVGAYFSSGDILDKGGQRLYLAPGDGILRNNDVRPSNNNGQFGLSLQATYGNYDVGLFGLRYDSKTPTVYLTPTFSSYTVVYPRDIWIEGTSASTTIGPTNVAAELSFRQHMNLATGANVSGTDNVNSNPAYPVGDTMAGQVSATYVSPGLRFDPGGFSFAGEVAFNHVLKVTQNDVDITGIPHRSSTAAQLQVTLTPQYLSVLPHLDINFPIGLGYNFYGRSMVDVTENNGTGFANVGVVATYNTVYSASLTYNQYFGAANPALAGEPSTADRSYVLADLQYSF